MTLDYLLNDSTESNEQIVDDEEGFYVNKEMANGFLLHETLKFQKMAWAIALLLGGIAFIFLFQEIGVLLYVMIMIASIALFVSLLLSEQPYLRLKKESLLFDKSVKNELVSIYMEKRKKFNVLIQISIVLFCISFFVLPLLTSYEVFQGVGDIILAISMILAGASVYSFVYLFGTLQAYRLLGKKDVQ
ncbi:hypothetical protein [Oceanobacillus jeddahense]|uniref:DUF3278 domain-containing protein n=1 Tax=Oceanobacillus jeddahense TaxID=1462527 RepID=A0ABY5JX99_9BACI|nr:hypothetical protein [Oceanobacillus jeddahense]UUI04956.1 hypothetical protein NP439_10095 [Oceanobacillus jeddahense]